MSNSRALDCPFEVNPDIIGIGVRISLYLLALCGPVLPFLFRDHALQASLEQSMGLMGLALLFTTLTFAARHELDLFHALAIMHLLGLVGVSITRPENKTKAKEGTFSDVKGRKIIFLTVALNLLYFLSIAGFLVFMVVVFATALDFGSQPECNSQLRYNLFGIDVLATSSSFRWFVLAYFVICIVAVIAGYSKNYTQETLDTVADALPSQLFFLALLAPTERSESFEAILEAERNSGKKGFAIVGQLFVRIYILFVLEVYLQRNTTNNDGNEWGFGQILAMLMLIGPLINITTVFFVGPDSTKDEYDDPFGIKAIRDNDVITFVATPLARAGICVWDMAWCAAAGAAAASAGARVNDNEVTTFIVQTGALGGVIASGTLGFSHFVQRAAQTVAGTAISLAANRFGTSFLVALAMCNRALGQEPVLLGSLVASLPLWLGNAWHPPGFPVLAIVKSRLFKQPSILVWAVGIGIGFDALAGFTLVAVAESRGYTICSRSAATAAASAYSFISYLGREFPTELWIRVAAKKPNDGMIELDSELDECA